MRKAAVAIFALIAVVAGVVGSSGAASALTAGSAEIIIIDSVKMGSPVFSTYSSCTGLVDHESPVVPATITATFITAPDKKPNAPYGEIESWDGGYGGAPDDHYGTAQAHARRQFFHTLAYASPFYFSGQGTYGVNALVQDANVTPALSTKFETFSIPNTAPASASADVKCSPVLPFDAKALARAAAEAAMKAAAHVVTDEICGGVNCWDAWSHAKDAYDNAESTSEMVDLEMGRIVEKDPPDSNYQQIATPNDPAPLPVDAGLTADQQSAYMNLEQALVHVIGLERAIGTSQNRMWGADNADSQYWHRRQLQAISDYSGQLSTLFGTLPQKYADFDASIEEILTNHTPPLSFSVSEQDGLDTMDDLYDHGLPSDQASDLSALGASPADQQELVDELLSIDPQNFASSNGVGAIFGDNTAGDYAGPMSRISDWAAHAVQGQAPVIGSVSPTTVDGANWTQVTVTGSHLAGVTGFIFGTSSPTSGIGKKASCTDTRCTVFAPPGSGTVDVIAVSPAGPSLKTPGDRISYNTSSSSPQVTGVSPASSSTTGGGTVTVSGSGLTDGTVYFGPTVSPTSTCSDTSCSAEVPGSQNPQTVDVTVVTSKGRSPVTAADEFTYVTSGGGGGAPVVTGVSPTHGGRLGGEPFTITGSNFTGADRVNVGPFGQLDPGSGFTVVDDSHITGTIPEGNTGTVDVRVSTPSGQSAINAPADEFTYDGQIAPTVTGITPSSGPDLGGTQVTISGSYLGGVTTHVLFGDTEADNPVCNESTCTVTAPTEVDGTVDVAVETNDGTSATSANDLFTYTPGPLPVVDKVTPDTGTTSGGTDLVVSGQNLNNGSVFIGGLDADPVNDYCMPTSCVVTAPAHVAGPADVTVRTVAGTSATSPNDVFTYANIPAPVVTSIGPSQGSVRGDTKVTIYGSDLTNGTVYFGNEQADGAICGQSTCGVLSPSSQLTGPVHVRVITPSGMSATTSNDEFTYVQPTVTSITPTKGWTTGGTLVTINGTDLSGADAYFGDQFSSATCTDTQCTATSPAQNAGTVDVQMRSDEGSSPISAADQFIYQVEPVPAVTAVSPASGTDQGGDQITVTGTNLDNGRVSFGSRVAAGSCAPTSCTVTSPVAAADGTVDVTVTNPTGTSPTTNADHFTYAPPGIPSVTSVSPATGSAAGGTTVTINGTNLTHGSVKFGSTAATGVGCTQSTCTATSPPGAVGTVDVTVTVSGHQSTTSTADRFAYTQPPVPTVTNVSPASGPASGGSVEVITGTDLHGATVSFGTHPATGVSCQDTQCVVTEPAGTVGTVDVTVLTVGGTSVTSSNDRFTYSPITITEHAVPSLPSPEGGGYIMRGIGGDMWFTMPSLNKIGRVTTAGTFTTYATPAGSGDSMPVGITLGPDGRMWYAEEHSTKLVAIDGSGNQTEYVIPGTRDDVRFVTAGPDGRLWFTLFGSGAIGAMTTTGTVTTYPLPNPYVGPYNIVTGPDGRLWFDEGYGDQIGAITTDGTITEYPLPDTAVQLWGLTNGGDGRLWFTEEAGPAIGAITTDGSVTTYRLDASDAPNPEGITYGPDGRLWFASPDLDQVNALDPSTGAVTDYAFPSTTTTEQPRYLAMDANGSLWVTEFGARNIAQVSGITSNVAPTVGAITPRYGSAGDSVTITGTNLGGASGVSFGGTPATNVSVVDPGHVTATVPAGTGSVPVTVTTSNGTSPAGVTFSYGSAPPPAPVVTGVSPSSGATSGGDTVTITGRNLTGGTVSFGTDAATAAACGDTSCTATTPSHAQDTVDVTVTANGTTSAISDADRFTFETPPPPAPSVTSISPSSGPVGGGTTVTINGTNLDGGSVTFGLDDASATCGPTSCSATAPPGAGGPVDIRVSTQGGTSAATANDVFTYIAPTVTPTTTFLTSTVNPTKVGDTIFLEALTRGSYVAGTVQFKDGTTNLGHSVTDWGGEAQIEVTLTGGTHTLHAVFTPTDTTHYSTSSSTLTEVVQPDGSDLSNTASAAQVTYGSPVTFSTTLTNTETYRPIPGAVVTLFARPSGATRWTKVGYRKTTSSGAASLAAKPSAFTEYHWVYTGNASHAAATSPSRTVSVLQKVTIKATKTSVVHGSTIKFYGGASPHGTGRTVYLQQFASGSWHDVASAVVKKQLLPNRKKGVGYVFSVALPDAGTFTYRVRIPAWSTLLEGDSAPVTVTVS